MPDTNMKIVEVAHCVHFEMDSIGLKILLDVQYTGKYEMASYLTII